MVKLQKKIKLQNKLELSGLKTKLFLAATLIFSNLSYSYPTQVFLKYSSPEHIQLIYKKFYDWNKKKFPDTFSYLPTNFEKKLNKSISQLTAWEKIINKKLPIKPIQFLYTINGDNIKPEEIMVIENFNYKGSQIIGYGFNFVKNQSFEIVSKTPSQNYLIGYQKKISERVYEEFTSTNSYSLKNDLHQVSRDYGKIFRNKKTQLNIFKTNGLPLEVLPKGAKNFSENVLYNFMFHINEIYYLNKKPYKISYP